MPFSKQSFSHKKTVLLCLIVSAALVLGTLAWLRFAPVTAAEGWKVTVAQDNLDRIVSLARMPDNSIFATLSEKQHPGDKGKGRLIKLDIPAQKYTVLAEGLYKPDGLLPYNGGVVLTQEYPEKSMLFWKDGVMQTLLTIVKPESIVLNSDGHWLVIEDAANGRLLDIDPKTYQQKELVGGFDSGEGVCVDKNKRIFVVDNKIPDLLEYVDGKLRHIPAKMRGAGFLRCTDKGIWITEDITNSGHLWFYDYKNFYAVASHLHAPQSVLEESDGSILVAEQGRSRLLRFSRIEGF